MTSYYPDSPELNVIKKNSLKSAKEIASWKTIASVSKRAIEHGIDSTNNGCPCDDCENDRVKADMRKNKVLPAGQINPSSIDELFRGYYPDSD